jgi:hypothetical protein
MHFNFGTADHLMGGWNPNFMRDDEMERIAIDMMQTEPGNFSEWSRKWLDLIVRFNYIVVDIPLYADLYYDFVTADLKNYHITPTWQWSFAIRFAHFE